MIICDIIRVVLDLIGTLVLIDILIRMITIIISMIVIPMLHVKKMRILVE